tara:strand:- start:49 stop:534 length:486 start_codon:yes stop_codon:yes gene_type:complete
MKKIFTIFICILIYQSGKSQDLTKIDIVGEWQFIELQDENGVKQTKIPLNRWQKDAVEKVNRDSYVFHEDGKYTAKNILQSSDGTWYFDSSTNEINLELRIDSEDPALESLKKHNLVTKRQDGSYYQKAVKKLILDCSEQTMKIKDREEYVLIYKRVNEKK